MLQRIAAMNQLAVNDEPSVLLSLTSLHSFISFLSRAFSSLTLDFMALISFSAFSIFCFHSTGVSSMLPLGSKSDSGTYHFTSYWYFPLQNKSSCHMTDLILAVIQSNISSRRNSNQQKWNISWTNFVFYLIGIFITIWHKENLEWMRQMIHEIID